MIGDRAQLECRPRPRCGRARWLRAGLTLIELIVVLAILVALGGLVVINSGRIAEDAQRKATDAVLREVRDAFVGSAAGPGYITDVGRVYDHDDDPLTPIVDQYRADMLFLYEMPAAATAFDPVTKTGWRGPYLKGWVSREAPAVPPDPPYVINSQPRDGWGSPIVLQIPDVPPAADEDEAKRYARLVSAGPDRVIDTPATWLGPDNPPVNDDVVVFLEVGS